MDTFSIDAKPDAGHGGTEGWAPLVWQSDLVQVAKLAAFPTALSSRPASTKALRLEQLCDCKGHRASASAVGSQGGRIEEETEAAMSRLAWTPQLQRYTTWHPADG